MASFKQKIKIDTPSKNVFPLSYRTRLTAVMGDIIPVLHKEILPGDDFRISLNALCRLAPLKAPIFDDVNIDFHAFFCPNRILDDKWKEFITGGVGLSSSKETDILPLNFNLTDLLWANGAAHSGANVSSLADYLNLHFAEYDASGRPVLPGSFNPQDYKKYLNSLPFLGYAKIWDDWYRNERIQEEVFPTWSELSTASSRLISSNGVKAWKLLKRNYFKDRYTTALPEPVIGGPVKYLPDSNLSLKSTDAFSGSTIDSEGLPGGSDVTETNYDSPLFVRLADAATATIQQLKTAFRTYAFFMKDTYNGNRYVEFIESHFDERVPDATLDRAIYLGSKRIPIYFGEVFQTSQTTMTGDEATSALGDYAGRGLASDSGFLFEEHFREHGQLYVLMSIVPKATYFQGIDRKFFKDDRFDYFFPEFQNIGDVPLHETELFFDYTKNGDDPVFGYQSRWCELKESLNEVHGDFLTDLRYWTFCRVFADTPKISPTFSEITPQNDPFVVQEKYSDNYNIDINFNVKALRPIMYYESF